MSLFNTRFSFLIATSVASACSWLNVSGYADTEQATSEDEGWRLRQAHVIFRHGARTPVFPLPGADMISFKLCAKINTPAGFSSDIPPLNPSIRFVQMHITELDGVSPRPYSVVDSYHGQVPLPGGECREGQLTELGAIQSSKLGRDIRKRYHNVLNLSPEIIEARSTNVGRCLATLSAVLGGVLHEEHVDVEELRKKHHHKIVHVKTTSSGKEYMIPNHSLCEKVKANFIIGRKNIDRDIEHSNNKQRVEALKKKLAGILVPDAFEACNLGKNNFVRINDWCMMLSSHVDMMEYEEIKQSNLHQVLEDRQLLEDIRKQAAKELAQLFGCRITPEGGYTWDSQVLENIRHGIGYFFTELTDKLNTPEKETNKRLHLYSGHDTTLIPLAIGLNIFQMDWPEYCSNITLELWERAEVKQHENESENGNDKSDLEAAESITDLETGLDNPSKGKVDNKNLQVRILWNGDIKKVMSLHEFNTIYSPLYMEWTKMSEECNTITKEERQDISAAGSNAMAY